MTSLVVAFLVAFLLLVAALLRDVIKDLAKQEIEAWVPHLMQRFVGDAVSRLPHELRGRYYTEWCAELASRSDRPLTKLLFAWDLRRAARAIALDYEQSLDRAPFGVSARLAARLAALQIALKRIPQAIAKEENEFDARLAKLVDSRLGRLTVRLTLMVSLVTSAISSGSVLMVAGAVLGIIALAISAVVSRYR